LLDGALRCFGRLGVLGAGIEEIRREAGASPSSVYHQFRDKNALVLALLERTFERLFGHLARRTSEAEGAEALVLALVGGHLEWILEHPEEGRFLYQAMALEMAPEQGAMLQQRKAELLVPVVQRFQREAERGALPAWSSLELDVVLLGPSHEACRRYLAGAPLRPAWMRETLPVLAWRSVQGGSAQAAPRSASSLSWSLVSSRFFMGRSARGRSISMRT
jgi:AcrR family transcriptional regulator